MELKTFYLFIFRGMSSTKELRGPRLVSRTLHSQTALSLFVFSQNLLIQFCSISFILLSVAFINITCSWCWCFILVLVSFMSPYASLTESLWIPGHFHITFLCFLLFTVIIQLLLWNWLFIVRELLELGSLPEMIPPLVMRVTVSPRLLCLTASLSPLCFYPLRCFAPGPGSADRGSVPDSSLGTLGQSI